jgi:23S rRNA (guanosine2251-2'-O)-methyltransferase
MGHSDKNKYENNKNEKYRYEKYKKVTPPADDNQEDIHAEETGSRVQENHIEGRNAVLEAFRSGRTIDKLYVLDGCQDGPVKSITREARKTDTIIYYVSKERLDQISETGKHQGVIAVSAAYAYSEVEDMLEAAKAKGEAPFLILLDGIEDPHNLGAILRTANLCGAHGVIIPKRRAVGLTPTVAKTSAGAINYTPVAKVTNISDTIRKLKEQGMWFVCADMGGTQMYDLNLTGPIGLVIGNEGEGVGKLVRENCDMIASIPMRGDIDSLNASVACGVMAYEIVRQRIKKG